MKKLYAVVWQGKRTSPPVCFPEREWAEQYRNCLKERIPLITRILFSLAGKPTYAVIELDFCEHPPTMAMTGNDTDT